MSVPPDDAAARARIRDDLDTTLLVEAAAGTGKTTELVRRIIAVLAAGRASVESLAAVTFTEKAAGELKLRLRAGLEAARQQAPGGGAAARHLEDALARLEEARVSTIHGFCADLLRARPVEARVDPQFRVLTEGEAERLHREAFERWLQACLEEPPEGVRRALRRPGWNDEPPGERLRRASWELTQWRDFPTPWGRAPFARDQAIDALLAQMVAFADLTERGASNDPLVRSTAALRAQRDDWRRAEAVAARDYDALEGTLVGWAQRREFTTWLKHGRGAFFAREITRQAVLALHADLIAALTAFQRAADADLAAALHAALRESVAAYEARKAAAGALDFVDLLARARDLVRDDGPVRAALQGHLTHLFVDEFQDTDPLQFAVFKAVYGAGDAPLFLVGDPKQAIYSFRNADLHTYLQARAQASAQYTLVENQRSTGPLIEALNGLFGTNPQAFMLPGLDYRAVELGAKPRKLLLDRTEARAALQVWTLPQDPESGEPQVKKQAQACVVGATAAEIARLLTAAHTGQITLDGKPLRAGDMAVLVRSHAEGSRMRLALTALRVGSVELSQSSIFQSPDAEELERLLSAILEPAREKLLRTAMSTELMGMDAAAIDTLAGDEARMLEAVQRFADLQQVWLQRGVGVMLRQWLNADQVAQRMLARADGERRLTNLLHLVECLHAASHRHPAPDALLRWFQTQRNDERSDDATQLRLESDQNLVQIVTIHRAKGLEYPIVFCPFLWNGRPGGFSDGLDGVEYHDDDGRTVIDYCKGFDDEYDEADVKARTRLDAAAEFLRLVYVALTRAVHRCVLVAGCYLTKHGKGTSPNESTHSLLNWLVAGAGMSPHDWFAQKSDVATIDAAWAALAHRCGPALAMAPLPAIAGVPVPASLASQGALAALAPPRHAPWGWWIGSYSALAHGAVHELAAVDHDLRVAAPAQTPEADAPGDTDVAQDDALRFPRGALAGECLHALFEQIDFTAPAHWPAAVASALRKLRPGSADTAPSAAAATGALHARMLENLLADVLHTPLPIGTADPLLLSQLPLERRLTELEFHLPSHRLEAPALNALLVRHGYAAPALGFTALRGFLKGYIDLVFEHQGRYFILDWKSNHLGHAPQDYAQEPMARAMEQQGYHLQYLLYSVALDRHLRTRLADYDPAQHFGGVLYLFVRGVRPLWRTANGSPTGVYFHRPAPAVLAQLSALFNPAAVAA